MNIPLLANASAPPALPDAQAIARNEKAATDFEALLLAPVLESLQKTFGGDPNSEDDKTVGASDYRHLATQAFSQAIASRGGIGIAQLILRHLSTPKAGAQP